MVEDFEDDVEVIVLTDEDGVDHEFELIETLRVGDREYAVLAPLDGDEDEGEDEDFEDEAIILRVETDENGERVFVDIEDDEEWERVAEAWEASCEEEDWDEEDEEDEEE